MSTTTSIPKLRDRPAWKALERHYDEVRGLQLRDLFAGDAARGERLTAEGAGLFLDYSKNRITDETVKLLMALAESRAWPSGPRRCSAGIASTCPRTAPCSTSPCACRAATR